MHSLEGTIAVNKAAILREYQAAIDDKNTELALRILRANPDVFPLTEAFLQKYKEQ